MAQLRKAKACNAQCTRVQKRKFARRVGRTISPRDVSASNSTHTSRARVGFPLLRRPRPLARHGLGTRYGLVQVLAGWASPNHWSACAARSLDGYRDWIGHYNPVRGTGLAALRPLLHGSLRGSHRMSDLCPLWTLGSPQLTRTPDPSPNCPRTHPRLSRRAPSRGPGTRPGAEMNTPNLRPDAHVKGQQHRKQCRCLILSS